jgi:hypothetical protein
MEFWAKVNCARLDLRPTVSSEKLVSLKAGQFGC